ncbi:hypothetical protein C9J19_05855 [Photobacterium phosphoreum]|uniref:hypothetical protein n=1 Tax=Photobacterium phosphoreum TaxID=659 RepID=UPI000D155E02|nr:hypothetical protein [Photobacterium phosphoreum]PSW29603.1 hypothetical protein C9J19_05855 [Photobacterium phosphoreum]
MNKHQQSGMTTLLITSMLLIVALLFSLASYKNLFYQIKRTQNEVLARQAHWAAEGGLECGFAQIQKAGNISDAKPTFSSCESELNLSDVNVDVDNYINSEYDTISNKLVKKKIKLSSSITGAIQSRSDLRLVGSYSISPDVEDIHNDGDYKCIAIRFSNEVKVEGSFISTPPKGNVSYDNFISGGNCSKLYKTHTYEFSNNWNINQSTYNNEPSGNGLFKMDLVRDTLFDPFESFFKDKVENIDNIKNDYEVISGSKNDYEVISGSKSDKDTKSCDYLVSEAFKLKNKVWVEGDCDLLSAKYLNELNETPRILVIDNGIVAIDSSSSFYGIIYHYINKDSNIYSNEELSKRWTLMPSAKFFPSYILDNSVFIQRGSFNPSGGMIFDTLNGHTTLISGMTLNFTNEANPNPPSKKISWQQGSWHDFEYKKNNRL